MVRTRSGWQFDYLVSNSTWKHSGINPWLHTLRFSNNTWYFRGNSPVWRGCGNVNAAPFQTISIPGVSTAYGTWTRVSPLAQGFCNQAGSDVSANCGAAWKMAVPFAGARVTGFSDIESIGGGCTGDNLIRLAVDILVR